MEKIGVERTYSLFIRKFTSKNSLFHGAFLNEFTVLLQIDCST